MYLEHFGLKEAPFSIAPNPRYLYLSRRHRDAIAHLLYGVQSGGFILLTGEVGAGKTTLCRSLLQQVPDHLDVALILNPRQSATELLASICDELGIAHSAQDGNKTLVDVINKHLLHSHARGRQTLLIVDEAQNLDTTVLEQLRLLTNLETDEQKLLQIILIGQPELRDLIGKPELRQLAQRITARYHLGSLSRDEIEPYLNHRLALCGVLRPLFSPMAVRLLYYRSKGLPRLINVICERALLGAYATGALRVDWKILARAADEVTGGARLDFLRPAAALLALAVLLSLVLFWQPALPPGQPGAAGGAEPLLIAPRNNRGNDAAFGPGEGGAPPAEDTAALARNTPNPAGPSADAVNPTAVPAPLEVPEVLNRQGSLDSAFVILYQRWGRRYRATRGGDPCLHAIQYRLRCMLGRGSLDELLNFNRPAVLDNVRADNGELLAAGLLGLDAEQALLTLGTEVRQVPRSLLRQRWSGDYILLWRPPNAYTAPLARGEEGPLVPWLARRRSRLQDDVPIQAAWLLEGDLYEWLLDFQRQNNLQVDGIAGPKTIILLRNAVGDQAPRLDEGQSE